MINTKDIYGTAGFLDGEGTFRMTKSNSVLVSAPQKNRQLLDRFGGSIYGPYKDSPSKCNIYTWQMQSTPAVSLMMTLYSIMSDKHKSEISKTLKKWKFLPFSASKHIEVFGKCKKGRDWIEENILIEKTGRKRCKVCSQARSQAYSKNYYLVNKDIIKNRSKLWKHTRRSSIELEV
jgi:hypothetical protein